MSYFLVFRDLPLGVIGTLLVVVFLYSGFSLVLTGMEPYASLNNNAPVVYVRLTLFPSP